MYTPKLYREEDGAKMIEFMRQKEFAVVVSYDGGKPTASHLLVEVFEEGERIFINGHMVSNGPVKKRFRGGWLCLLRRPQVTPSPGVSKLVDAELSSTDFSFRKLNSALGLALGSCSGLKTRQQSNVCQNSDELHQ